MAARKELLRHFDRMESERQRLIGGLSGYSDATLSRKPASDVWSVAEIIEHLTAAENGALNYMRKKIEFGGHRKAAATAGLKQWFLNLAISLPIKYRVPEILETQSDSPVGFREASDKWDEVRGNLRSEYETMDEDIIGNELFKHVSAGKLNVIQGVRFMRQHANRHIGQMHRTIRKVR